GGFLHRCLCTEPVARRGHVLDGIIPAVVESLNDIWRTVTLEFPQDIACAQPATDAQDEGFAQWLACMWCGDILGCQDMHERRSVGMIAYRLYRSLYHVFFLSILHISRRNEINPSNFHDGRGIPRPYKNTLICVRALLLLNEF